MGRRPNPQRKIEVLDDVTEQILRRGLHQTPMRALANDLGTSTYTFVYHFGSKDGMIEAVLTKVGDSHDAALADLAPTMTGSLTERVEAYWAWSLRPDQLAATALMIDALSLARVDAELYGPPAERHAATLQAFLTQQCCAAGIDPVVGGSLATAIVGLQVWYLATRDDAGALERVRALVDAVLPSD